VERLRDQLLAGAALPGDHHGGAAVGRLADGLEDVEDLRAAPDEILEPPLPMQLTLEREVLLLKPATLEGVGDRDLQLVELERLGDVVVGPELHGLHGGLRRGVGRDDQDHRPRRVLLGRLEDREAVELAHPEIGHHEIEGLRLEPFDRRLTAVGHGDLEAGLPEHDGEQVPHALLVVDDQYAGIRHREPAASR
jgi:hypothetical protein